MLIVDDDVRLIRAYTLKLEHEGFVVRAESDALRVLEVAAEFLPDLIVLDVLLPKKTGWEILKELKADENLTRIPVVLVSNIGSTEKEIEAIDNGAEAYLVKSNTPLSVLIEKVQLILDSER